MRRHYSIREFNVKTLIDLHQDKRLSTETAYQRGRVWREREKHFLVDSLARGLPIGMITLFSRRDEEGLEVFDVIDGKQRITTIIEYVNDGFILPVELQSEIPTSTFRKSGEITPVEADDQAQDDEDVMVIDLGQSQRELLQGQAFSQMKSSTRNLFKDASVPAFVVAADKRHLAIDIFVRMNRNVKGLVPQEIRNAVFHQSQALAVASRISKSLDRSSKSPLDSSDRWFCESGFMKVDRFDRQADIQFILELLSLRLNGPSHRRDDLDLLCERFIAPSPTIMNQLQDASDEVEEALKKVKEMCAKGFKHCGFPTTAQIENDVYALVGALFQYKKSLAGIKTKASVYGEAIQLFRSLATRLNHEAKKGRERQGPESGSAGKSLEDLAHRYSATYLGGQTNSLDRRQKRIAIWLELLESVSPSNDEKRLFDESQKALIWARASRKVCAKCQCEVQVGNWDAGHIVAHKDGGRTDIDNGQIECTDCNRSGR